MADKALSIAAMHDVNGNSLVMEADDALQKIEDHMQSVMEGTLNDPPDKPYKVVITMEVLATGQTGRVIDWTVDTKYPSTARKHSQQAVSVGGTIVPLNQPTQSVLDLQRQLPEQEQSDN